MSNKLLKTDGVAYADCMSEVKKRLIFIKDQLASRKYNQYQLELVCLQFRKICEFIAFSSLSSHKELYEKKYNDYQKHWNFTWTLKNVKELNKDYFPKSCKIKSKLSDDGIRKEHFLFDGDSTFLDEKQLSRIFKFCSDRIHAKNIYLDLNLYPSSRSEYDEFYLKLDNWLKGFVEYLEEHKVRLINKDLTQHIIAVMYFYDEGKGVEILTVKPNNVS